MATSYSEFINKLSSLTGLHPDVVAAWVARENGRNNNALGLTSASAKTASNPHGLLSFPSQTAAAIATASVLQSSANYKGIRASESGTSKQQALAIAQSPWRLGGTGLKAQGGTDPYYFAGFVKAGILSLNDKPGGGVSTPITPPVTMPPTNPVGNAVSFSDWQSKLSSVGISTDPAHVISQSEAVTIVEKLYGVTSSDDRYKGLVSLLTGKTVGDAALGGTVAPLSGLNLPNLDLVGALMFVAVVFVGIAFIATGGLISLKGKS